MDAGGDETAAGTRRRSLSCQVWLWEGQMRRQRVQLSTDGSHLHRSMQLQQQRNREACDNVDMIENDSCDGETSDEQDHNSEEDEDDE